MHIFHFNCPPAFHAAHLLVLPLQSAATENKPETLPGSDFKYPTTCDMGPPTPAGLDLGLHVRYEHSSRSLLSPHRSGFLAGGLTRGAGVTNWTGTFSPAGAGQDNGDGEITLILGRWEWCCCPHPRPVTNPVTKHLGQMTKMTVQSFQSRVDGTRAPS